MGFFDFMGSFFSHEFNADLNNDGVNDAYVKSFDADGDGVSHLSLIDNRGRFFNGFGVDLDGDGNFDITYTLNNGWDVDLNDNGINEVNFIDTDGDGNFDKFVLDINGDGRPELQMFDHDGDGHFEDADPDGFNTIIALKDLIKGIGDESGFVSPASEDADPFDADSYDDGGDAPDFDVDDYDYDTDGGDGIDDGSADDYGYDADGDDSFDDDSYDDGSDIYNDGRVPVDLDGDGVIDGYGYDKNGDGEFDVIGYDYNGDGIVDDFGYNINIDEDYVDGNGSADDLGYDTNGGADDYGYDADGGDSHNDDGGIAVDIDGDGYNEGVAYDTNGDGSIDRVVSDIDGDGIVDTIAVDMDYDGSFDAVGIDTDGDGQIDTIESLKYVETVPESEPENESADDGVILDVDGDGYSESIAYDTDGDGVIDKVLTDTDGDGKADMIQVDTDHDGSFDTYAFDTDGDGEFDTIRYDADGDGIIDEAVPFDGTLDGEPTEVPHETKNILTDNEGLHGSKYNYYDPNTGKIAGTREYIDSDGDGNVDTVIRRYDSNGDGVFDTTEQFYDTDGDGQVDEVVKTVLVDTDGDGVYDTYSESVDEEADGTFDVVRVYDYDASTDIAELVHIYDNIEIESGIYTTEAGYFVTDGNTFDPSAVDPDKIVGNPGTSMEYWKFQGETNRCGIYAQKFIIEQYTGRELDIEEICDLAESKGWFAEKRGTFFGCGDMLLKEYGVPCDTSVNNDLGDLRDALDSGKQVIVWLDSGEYWGTDIMGDDVFSPADGLDHAVQVIGIDESDPENPMVILNDSGSKCGCGELVPMDVFADAWDDSNCYMTVAG